MARTSSIIWRVRPVAAWRVLLRTVARLEKSTSATTERFPMSRTSEATATSTSVKPRASLSWERTGTHSTDRARGLSPAGACPADGRERDEAGPKARLASQRSSRVLPGQAGRAAALGVHARALARDRRPVATLFDQEVVAGNRRRIHAVAAGVGESDRRVGDATGVQLGIAGFALVVVLGRRVTG